jgi:signal peptidase I
VELGYPERLIKRIIGLPGEVIRLKNNKVYINDRVMEGNCSGLRKVEILQEYSEGRLL